MATIRPARPEDVPAIVALVSAAYEPYLASIGVRPLPLDDDYAARVDRGEAFVAGGDDGSVDGLLVLVREPEYLLVDNVAVRPDVQGRGVGRGLLAFAEARARASGLAELRLYTNVRMVENRRLYARLGYVELDRAVLGGRDAVWMRKRL
jgi:GNAT superfamily N-acetyltransferase